MTTNGGARSLVINAVVDRGANRDSHAFELYGSYRGPLHQVRPEVVCNGRQTEAEIMATPLAGQINVNVEAMPGSSSCSFVLQRLPGGERSNSFSLVTSVAPIEIRGLNDRGVTDGRRFVELYGDFPDAADLEPRVLCVGRYVAAGVEFASAAQVNVSLPDAGPATGCTFQLRNWTSGLASPRLGAGLPPPKTNGLKSVGAYFWGGVPSTPEASLVTGQAALNAAGFGAARLVITPRMRSGNPDDNWYGLDLGALNASCPPEQPFLPCAIRTAPYQNAISAPSLKTVVLTAYDSATSGPHGERVDFVNPAFWTRAKNRQAVYREFRDLTFALHQTQHDTGKTFVLASWEGDNQAYCGSFYRYYVDARFRASCGSVDTRNDALQAITQWWQWRQEGIRAGSRAAEAAGFHGVRVSDGVEFNIDSLNNVYEVDGVVLRTVLRDVVPRVQPSYVLYSSYDSQNRSRMDEDLRKIKAWMATKTPRSNLAIGEVGFPRHGIDAADIFRTVATVLAIQRVEVVVTILWEAYDGNGGDRVMPFGVLHPNGERRWLTAILQRELARQAVEMATPQEVRILAAADAGLDDEGSHRYYELYGEFPGAGFAASALCDGIATHVDVTYESTGQINLRIPHRDVENRFCTFRLHRGDGVQTLAFGPVVACADGARRAPCF